MQITINNDFMTYENFVGQKFTQAQIDSFLQDEQIAVNILNATFTNPISLTFNVGFGSYPGDGKPIAPGVVGLGGVNFDAAVFLSYSQLRANLLTVGQPGFFNAANLPEGDSINGMSNFWVSPALRRLSG